MIPMDTNPLDLILYYSCRDEAPEEGYFIHHISLHCVEMDVVAKPVYEGHRYLSSGIPTYDVLCIRDTDTETYIYTKGQ